MLLIRRPTFGYLHYFRIKLGQHETGFFTDEKLFTVVPPPTKKIIKLPGIHTAGNQEAWRDINGNRLLRTRSTFSKSVMIGDAVTVSKLGCTNRIFFETAAKIHGQY